MVSTPVVSEPRPVANWTTRSRARLAIVQALYQMELTGRDVVEIADEFEKYRLAQDEEGNELGEVDVPFFRAVLIGVVGAQRRLDPIINAHLAPGWRLDRLDAILRALLRAGAYELTTDCQAPHPVVINEYVSLAHDFFDDELPHVVNAVLDAIIQAKGTRQ